MKVVHGVRKGGELRRMWRYDIVGGSGLVCKTMHIFLLHVLFLG